MFCNCLHEFGRHENSVHERQRSQQAQRIDETRESRIVVNVQRGHQGRESVRMAHVFIVRGVRHVLGPANGK